MKRLLKVIFLAFVIASVYSMTSGVVAQTMQNKDVKKVEVTHDQPKYVKKGNYIYKYDTNDKLLGYYRKTPSGKYIEYDEAGKKIATYKETPGGDLDIKFFE